MSRAGEHLLTMARAAARGSVATPSRLASVVLLIVCALMQMTPAFLGGGPFLFYDSQQYFEVGERIIEAVTPDVAAGGAPADAALAPGGDAVAADADDGGGLAAISGGRSPVYGLLLYGLSTAASMWFVAAVQALVTAWLIIGFLDFAWGGRRVAPTLATVAGLTALTPLGFHTSFMMPDIFAAVCVLAIVRLAFDKSVGRIEAAILAGVIAFAAATHATILALAFTAVALLAGVRLISSLYGVLDASVLRKGAIAWSVAALACVIGFNTVYGWAGERITRHPLRSPPYLMARVIADGTGELFLANECQEQPARYTVCRLAGETYADQNDFLWGGGATRSFSSLDADMKNGLQDEEKAFVLDVVAHYPLTQVAASAKNAVGQFFSLGSHELLYGAAAMFANPTWRTSGILEHTPGAARCRADAERCVTERGGWAVWARAVQAASFLSIAAFTAVLAAWLVARRRATGRELAEADRLLLAGAFIGVVLIINAVLCGVLSGPADRYQTRLVWLLALFLAASAPLMPRLRAAVLRGPARPEARRGGSRA